MRLDTRSDSWASNKIIFDSLSGQKHRLLALDVSTRSVDQLFVTEHWHRFSPSFSPSTQRLAVTHCLAEAGDEHFRPEIILVSLNGEPPARLSSLRSPHYYAGAATFSPDGKRLGVEIGFDHEYNPDLYVFDGVDRIVGDWALDRQVALIENPLRIGIHAPRFFPDGQRLIYLRNYAYEDALEVCLTDLTQLGEPENNLDPDQRSGHMERLFGSFRKYRLTHSADVVWHRPNALALHTESETALFIRGHSTHEYEQICAVPCAADARQDPLATSSITENFAHIGGIHLSPDGLQVAFDGDGQLFVAALDGGDLIQLTEAHDGKCTCAAFSPDSSRIAFAMSGGAKPASIWSTDRSGNRAEQLVMCDHGTVHDLLWI